MLESKERTPIALQTRTFMNIIDSNKLFIKEYINIIYKDSYIRV